MSVQNYSCMEYGLLIADDDFKKYLKELNEECGSGEEFEINDFYDYAGISVVTDDAEDRTFNRITENKYEGCEKFEEGIVVGIKWPDLFKAVYNDFDEIVREITETLEKNNLKTKLITPDFIRTHISLVRWVEWG